MPFRCEPLSSDAGLNDLQWTDLVSTKCSPSCKNHLNYRWTTEILLFLYERYSKPCTIAYLKPGKKRNHSVLNLSLLQMLGAKSSIFVCFIWDNKQSTHHWTHLLPHFWELGIDLFHHSPTLKHRESMTISLQQSCALCNFLHHVNKS